MGPVAGHKLRTHSWTYLCSTGSPSPKTYGIERLLSNFVFLGFNDAINILCG